MRRLWTSLAMAAALMAIPMLAIADNQEIATQIAKNLRDGGQLQDYKIGVKYQDGIAWLRGHVRDEEQMSLTLRVVSETVGVKRVVNGLSVVSPPASNAIRPSKGALAPEQPSTAKRLEQVIARGQQRPLAQPQTAENPGHADRVASTFQTAAAQPVAVAQPVAANGPADIVQPHPARIPGRPLPVAYMQAMPGMPGAQAMGRPIPAYVSGAGGSVAPARYDQPNLPNYAWPSYAAYPNYAALTYPKQYSPTAWPFIGPFYPYPQVPLGWRKVTLEWDDGWWMLDFRE
ncbi:MAG: BON domain-containing protein [Pirellulales bacterium]|nr:BON domain-containing protein [Pirellulales bacterium]